MEKQVKVLVVDDDPRMLKTICDILRIKGYAVTGAYSGEQALEKVRAERPDCVLMDIRMPGINGVETLRRIKDQQPDLPVTLMSAHAPCELEQEALRLGAHTVITKPIDFQIVLAFLSMLGKEESTLYDQTDDPDH